MEDIKKKKTCWTSRGENYNVWGEKYLDRINSRLDTAGENISVLESIVIETMQNETHRGKKIFFKRTKYQWAVEQFQAS